MYCGFAVRGEANRSKAFTHNSMNHNSLHDVGEEVKAFFEKWLMRASHTRVVLGGKANWVKLLCGLVSRHAERGRSG